jgi:hypothetical protein
MNNAFNSVASSGFIFPAKTKLSCLRLNAASKRSCSSSVSELFGVPLPVFRCRLLQQSVNGLISLCFIGLSIFYPDVDKISIELLKALDFSLYSNYASKRYCSIESYATDADHYSSRMSSRSNTCSTIHTS